MNAVGKWLDNNRTPGRKVKQMDNRGANFYVALYWAEELAAKDSAWSPLAKALKENEEDILKDLPLWKYTAMIAGNVSSFEL